MVTSQVRSSPRRWLLPYIYRLISGIYDPTLAAEAPASLGADLDQYLPKVKHVE